MSDKPLIPFPLIAERIRTTPFPAADAVVGILTGGAIPASIIAFHLQLPLFVVGINFREPGSNIPRHETPAITAQPPELPPGIKSILLVDDVAVSGKTLAAAAALFPHMDTHTVVLKGKAQTVIFPNRHGCVQWPWNPCDP